MSLSNVNYKPLQPRTSCSLWTTCRYSPEHPALCELRAATAQNTLLSVNYVPFTAQNILLSVNYVPLQNRTPCFLWTTCPYRTEHPALCELQAATAQNTLLSVNYMPLQNRTLCSLWTTCRYSPEHPALCELSAVTAQNFLLSVNYVPLQPRTSCSLWTTCHYSPEHLLSACFALERNWSHNFQPIPVTCCHFITNRFTHFNNTESRE
jgi:hypothetical protein